MIEQYINVTHTLGEIPSIAIGLNTMSWILCTTVQSQLCLYSSFGSTNAMLVII